MLLHDLLADRQSDARAGILASPVKVLEDDEDPFMMLWRYADAVVTDGEKPLTILPRGADVDITSPVGMAELDGIADQVLKELRQLAHVAATGRKSVMRHRRASFLDAAAKVEQSSIQGPI